MLILAKTLLNNSSQRNFLRIRNQNLLRNLFFHSVSGNGKHLFNNLSKQNVAAFRSNLKNNDSIFSSWLTLLVRRSRLAAKEAVKKSGPELKKAKLNNQSLKRLFALAKPEKYKIMVAMVFLIISSSVTMAIPFGIGKLIDFLQTGDKETMQDNLKSIALIMTAVFVIGALANFGRVYMIQSTGQRIVMRMRKNLFASIMNQEMAFFDQNKTGELINRLSSDTEVIGQSISQNLSDGLRSTIQVITGVGMMFYLSPYLAIVGLRFAKIKFLFYLI
jgi:ABC-type bacteriocin/lantibiotic exporter with double-glycine peptidase domain